MELSRDLRRLLLLVLYHLQDLATRPEQLPSLCEQPLVLRQGAVRRWKWPDRW
jgi:hypothetical protein